jgi:hypothetical protein
VPKDTGHQCILVEINFYTFFPFLSYTATANSGIIKPNRSLFYSEKEKDIYSAIEETFVTVIANFLCNLSSVHFTTK